MQAGRLAANGTLLWIYCGNGALTDRALASPDAFDSSHTLVDAYLAAGVRNGVFNFPEGIHSWDTRVSSCSR